MNIQMTDFLSDKQEGNYDNSFNVEKAEEVLAFHQSLNGYQPTPLASLKELAEKLGIAGLYVKDESRRFGLNAFKGLGGSYALARIMSEKTGKPVDQVASIPADSFTFVTATDGNHGRGVAWAAKNLHQKAVVYMPKGSSAERLNNIRRLGATAEITGFNYDDTVRFSRSQAEANGWTLVQDTAWEGYETIPTWIMQGYMTMAAEMVKQLPVKPTHIFLQAGVGAMAGSMTGFFHSVYRDSMPKMIYAEPDQADCLFCTAKAADGVLHKAAGNLESIMAGLCCGEVCTVGWEVIRHHADFFFSCPDYIAADGMRVLGNPTGADPRVISGESGAITTGLVYHLLMDTKMGTYRKALDLNDHSVILCISTEGDTDRENYRHIVWDGWYKNPDSQK
ncbi:MAG: diaminopropionate ammonia-lyase [Clostridiales bacterium]|nr:diaminopropionate ammonia-lyase [Clostridiales bacterium]